MCILRVLLFLCKEESSFAVEELMFSKFYANWYFAKVL